MKYVVNCIGTKYLLRARWFIKSRYGVIRKKDGRDYRLKERAIVIISIKSEEVIWTLNFTGNGVTTVSITVSGLFLLPVTILNKHGYMDFGRTRQDTATSG